MIHTISRRNFWGLCSSLGLSCFTGSAKGQSEESSEGSRSFPVTVEGKFADAFNAFIKRHWEIEHFYGAPMLDVTSRKQWKEVKKAWKVVEKHLNDFYDD